MRLLKQHGLIKGSERSAVPPFGHSDSSFVALLRKVSRKKAPPLLILISGKKLVESPEAWAALRNRKSSVVTSLLTNLALTRSIEGILLTPHQGVGGAWGCYFVWITKDNRTRMRLVYILSGTMEWRIIWVKLYVLLLFVIGCSSLKPFRSFLHLSINSNGKMD